MSKQKKTRRSRRRKKGNETLTTSTSSTTVVAAGDLPRRDLRRQKRPHDGSSGHHDKRDKKMRWTECNRHEVSRLHRDCRQKGQPLAPYNTTQFIMNEHNAEKEIDFDQLSGQIQQMHNNRHRPHNGSTNGSSGVGGSGSGTAQDGSASASGRLDDSNRDDYYYSSPEDESYFLEQQFQHDYNTMHAERLNSMSKSELLKEYLIIEKELEHLRQKSPSGSSAGAAGASSSRGDASAISFTTITKSPRPPSMPSSPRGQYLNVPFAQQQQQLLPQSSSRNQHNHHHHHHSRHHHYHSSNGNSSSHNRCLKENKRLRKLLKQVYSRYNSLMYCINYVNTTNNSGEASAFQVDDSGVSVQHNPQPNSSSSSSNHLSPPSLTPDDYQMSNEMHFRIEKYISNPSPSPLTSSTSRGGDSSSSASYTSSNSSTSSSTSVTSEEDGPSNDGGRLSTASTPTILEPQQRAKRSSSSTGGRSTSTTPTSTPVRPAGNSSGEQQQQPHYEATGNGQCGSSSTELEAREVLHKLVDLVVDDDDDVEGN